MGDDLWSKSDDLKLLGAVGCSSAEGWPAAVPVGDYQWPQQSPWEGPYTVVECLSYMTYQIRGRRKAQPKVVHINRLWQYHGPGQYTWEDSEELSPATDEDQTGDPGSNQGHENLENPTMNMEEEHCSLLVELDVTGEGGHSDND
ncbi:hypothetical protein Hamer_G003360 [Homarus americanus]|uniref:Integrase p58-like C-terminal domain-containing protein n=1 Tax=Homarus americanus TaxID=6706 RepID=A0A8J5N792_HOMAM|nr:hypothetical protein Hamer_G003360 [Homarus americanus]